MKLIQETGQLHFLAGGRRCGSKIEAGSVVGCGSKIEAGLVVWSTGDGAVM